MIKPSAATLAWTVFSAVLQGCAVPPADIAKRFESQSDQSSRLLEQQAHQRLQENVVTRIKGNYVGAGPVELGYKATLPAAFRDVTLRYPDTTSLRVVAERITQVTRMPVSVSADAAPLSTSAQAIPVGGGIGNSVIPMDFSGHLADYLDQVCARLGLGWSYNNGTIDISRQVTRTFQLAASPGTVSFGSRVTKGSSSSTGSSGGSSSASTTGSFSGTSDTGVDAKLLSAWESTKAAITAMLTPSQGKLAMNETTGTVVVTDTRAVLDQVARLIDHENNLLTRQVTLQVQMFTLQLDDQTQLGIDANPVLKALSGQMSLAASTVGSLTSASAGGLTYSILSGRATGTTVNARALDGVGRVLSNTSTTLVTTHRVPVPLAQFATKGYLASTSPASGGAVSAGTGVPGLTPGSVTTGLFLSALPTILDNSSLLLRLSIDSSTLQGIDSQATGSGATFQQIQTPSVTGYKSDHNITLREGQTLVLVGLSNDSLTGQNQMGLLGGSLLNKKVQQMQIILVTPRVHAGV